MGDLDAFGEADKIAREAREAREEHEREDRDRKLQKIAPFILVGGIAALVI